MKWYQVFTVWCIGVVSYHVYGQKSLSFFDSSYILPYKLEVGFNKTSNLIFPEAITSIDRGSADIIVEKAVGVENILRVKADVKTFAETNLSVITSDGKLYSFLVNYTDNPSYFNIKIGGQSSPDVMCSTKRSDGGNKPAFLSKLWLQTYGNEVLSKNEIRKSPSYKESKMTLRFDGLYIKDNVMFCKLQIENRSAINYDINSIKLYVRDKNLPKRTTSQEREIQPLFIFGDTSEIIQSTKAIMVIAVPKFTIQKRKYLAIEIMEQNGSRHLALKLKNRHIMDAKVIH